MRSIDLEGREAEVYEGSEYLKTWASVAKRPTNDKRNNKTIEKLERVDESMLIKKSEIRKEIEESNYESRRMRRMIVFYLEGKRR